MSHTNVTLQFHLFLTVNDTGFFVVKYVLLYYFYMQDISTQRAKALMK